MSEPLLFNQFPSLREQLGYLPLTDLPTPVQPLPDIADHLWVKRDDLTSQRYGGNKVRKLEWILADAQQRQADELVTFGATGTHHGLACAIHCHDIGMRCRLHLFPQPASDKVTENLALLKKHGATLVHHHSLFAAVLAWYLDPRRLRRRSYFLFAGGSSALGALAFVNAALEFAQQVHAGECPEPELIYCPVGSSGTAAGLTLGCAIAGLKTRVIGVRVAPANIGPFDACSTRTIAQLMDETLSLLNNHGAEIELTRTPKPELLEQYYGAGYGAEDDAGNAASVRFRAAAGIDLDQTYTSKTFAAVLDECRQQPDRQVLYWHTLNSANLR